MELSSVLQLPFISQRHDTVLSDIFCVCFHDVIDANSYLKYGIIYKMRFNIIKTILKS